MSQEKLSILVTGSNQGLGLSTARHLSKLPHVHLFLCGRDINRVQEAAEKLKGEDGCAAVIDTILMDISDDASIHAAVADLEQKLGGAALDVLVVSVLHFLSRATFNIFTSFTEQCRRLPRKRR